MRLGREDCSFSYGLLSVYHDGRGACSGSIVLSSEIVMILVSGGLAQCSGELSPFCIQHHDAGNPYVRQDKVVSY